MASSIRLPPAPERREAAERGRRRRCAPTTPAVALVAAALAGACVRWEALKDFAAYGRGGGGGKARRNPAPYGRIGGRPIIPNPEAEKFPAGVPRDEDGFPVITLREQYETNTTMYNEGLGPFPGPPMDFSGDWDFVPPDPEDPDFDPDAPLGKPPLEPPQELLSLQPAGAIVFPEVTPDEPIPEGGSKRKVAAAPEPEPAAAGAGEDLPDNLKGLKVPELKKLLEDRGLPAAGTKAALIKRLEESAGR